MGETWALIQENGLAHSLDCRIDKQFLNESVQIFVLNPISVRIQLTNLFREKHPETIPEVLQAWPVKEVDSMLPGQEVVTIKVVEMRLRINARIIDMINLLIVAGEELRDGDNVVADDFSLRLRHHCVEA